MVLYQAKDVVLMDGTHLGAATVNIGEGVAALTYNASSKINKVVPLERILTIEL